MDNVNRNGVDACQSVQALVRDVAVLVAEIANVARSTLTPRAQKHYVYDKKKWVQNNQTQSCCLQSYAHGVNQVQLIYQVFITGMHLASVPDLCC